MHTNSAHGPGRLKTLFSCHYQLVKYIMALSTDGSASRRRCIYESMRRAYNRLRKRNGLFATLRYCCQCTWNRTAEKHWYPSEFAVGIAPVQFVSIHSLEPLPGVSYAIHNVLVIKDQYFKETKAPRFVRCLVCTFCHWTWIDEI